MSVNFLPNEILQEILKYLKGKDVIKCRRVCQRWKCVVDGLGDRYWLEACREEHTDLYKEAYRKASLSWRQLYKSLALWPKISSAHVTINKISTNARIFQVLQNGVIAYRQRIQDTCPDDQYDTIIYYNLVTHKETHREFFDSPFRLYKENDFFIVLDSTQDDLVRVIPKADRLRVTHFTNVQILLKNEICTQIGNKLSCIKFVESDNGLILETEDIENFNYKVKEFAAIGSCQVNIFADDGLILSRIGKEIKLITSYEDLSQCSNSTFEVVERLKSFGFNWCLPVLFRYVHLRIRTLGPYILDTIYAYGNFLLMGFCTPKFRKIHIYSNPFDASGELDVFYRTPDKTIDLCMKCHVMATSWQIQQIDVVEMENGHKIVVAFRDSIYIVDLTHEAPKEECMEKTSLFTYCSLG